MKLKIKYFNIITIVIILIINFFIICKIQNLLNIQDEIKNQNIINSKMEKLVYQLKDNTEHLSSFAKDYVITKNNKFKEKFNTLLELRNGIAYLPLNYYNSFYWNLSKENKKKFNLITNKKLILLKKIKKLPYSDYEIKKLNKSLIHFKNLINILNKAILLVEKEQNKAISLLYSTSFNKEKNNTILPLENFINSLNTRNKIENKILMKKMKMNLSFIFGLFVLMVIILILIEFIIIKKILKPIENLTESIKSYSSKNYFLPDLKLFSKDELGVLAKEFIKMKNIEEKQIYKLIEDEEKLLEKNEEFQYLATHDTLTNLPNRLFFQNELNNQIKIHKKENKKLALFFIDLDYFKEINDSLGHKIGDEVLKVVSKKLKNIVKKTDLVCRLSGDEFTIIFNNLKNKNDIINLAKRIVEDLAENMIIKNYNLYVTSSIGISIFPDDGNTADDLLKYSDTAMYKAKDNGKNGFEFYDKKMTALSMKRVVMETRLRESIKNKDFLVYFQPQYNSITNKIIGLESLVRWKHPNLGFIFPDKFIPLAEETGLIISLDRFVMETAINKIVEWHKIGLNPGVLSLNLSIKQLQEKDFLKYLKILLLKTNCKPEWIELEITEGQVMQNPEEAINILNNINNIGIKLSIDDFGTGYSSLSYLKKLPIHKLKIDRTFIKDLENDEDDRLIIKGIISLANSLNIDTIAEGVETIKQKEFLKENGCIQIQGYLYNKPMPMNIIEKLLIELNEKK